MKPTTGAAIRILDHRAERGQAALAMLLRQLHEAATAPGLPPEIEDATARVVEQVIDQLPAEYNEHELKPA